MLVHRLPESVWTNSEHFPLERAHIDLIQKPNKRKQTTQTLRNPFAFGWRLLTAVLIGCSGGIATEEEGNLERNAEYAQRELHTQGEAGVPEKAQPALDLKEHRFELQGHAEADEIPMGEEDSEALPPELKEHIVRQVVDVGTLINLAYTSKAMKNLAYPWIKKSIPKGINPENYKNLRALYPNNELFQEPAVQEWTSTGKFTYVLLEDGTFHCWHWGKKGPLTAGKVSIPSTYSETHFVEIFSTDEKDASVVLLTKTNERVRFYYNRETNEMEHVDDKQSMQEKVVVNKAQILGGRRDRGASPSHFLVKLSSRYKLAFWRTDPNSEFIPFDSLNSQFPRMPKETDGNFLVLTFGNTIEIWGIGVKGYPEKIRSFSKKEYKRFELRGEDELLVEHRPDGTINLYAWNKVNAVVPIGEDLIIKNYFCRGNRIYVWTIDNQLVEYRSPDPFRPTRLKRI